MSIGLLAIGEAMAELRQADASDAGFSVGFAGDTFNTAIYCARQGANRSVAYLTRVGRDPLSSAFLALSQREQVDTQFIDRHPSLNIGVYSVSTDSSGERTFHYWRESSAARTLFSKADEPIELPKARIVYLSGITLAIMQADARQHLIDHLHKLSESGQSLIAFDSNYRPKLWESKRIAQEATAAMWDIADIALPSIDDEMDLFGDVSEDAVIKRFSNYADQMCAIKRGSQGPVSPHLVHHPQFTAAAKVIDTTAAGDSFNGAYLAGVLDRASEVDCLIAGHECAKQVVAQRGAIIPR